MASSAQTTHEPDIVTAPTATSTSQSILEILMLTLLQQQPRFNPYGPNPYALPPAPPTPLLAPSLPPSPTKPKHWEVLLDEFCTHYSISTADQKQLEKLEYCPGNAINKLDREDWQLQAGFSKLAWNQMLAKHEEFLHNVKNGLWA
jgi:hypothetical protein